MSIIGDFASALVSASRRDVGRPLTEWLGDVPSLTDSGVAVNSENSMRLSAVYASRRIISYTVAGLPASVLMKKPAANGRTVRAPYMPRPGWVDQPNRDQTWPEFIAQAVDSLLSDGNLFVDTSNKSRSGLPSALYVIDPSVVVVGRTVDTKELVYIGTDGLPLDRANVLHVRALTLAGHDRGLSPIKMARQEIGIGQAAQKFSAKFFVNGATVSALLEFPADMSQDQVTESAATFKELYTGADKAHSVAAVAGGTYKSMAVSQKDAQFLESRQFTVVDIGTRIYGIPPHRLGAMLDVPQFGDSIEQQNMAFVQDAVLPWTTLIEAGFNRSIVPKGAYLHFELNGLLRGDAKSRADFYQTMRQQLGVLNADDILELEDRNPLPDGKGQAYWMPANTYLVGDEGYPILPERQSPPGASDDPLEPMRADKLGIIRERRRQDEERGRDAAATREFAERALQPLEEAYRRSGRVLDTDSLLKEALS